ncbi:MAG: YeeE/YedE family protein [Methylophilus sp.]
MINWSTFTPLSSLVGGILIGIATAILILINGRIAGISGILGGLLTLKKDEMSWRLAFIGGISISSLLYLFIHPLPSIVIKANYIEIAIAGLLVGFGTRLGSGCTSGHGICGVSRLSVRSITATLTFIATGMFTVYLMKVFG